MNLPNRLTLLRVLLVPLFVAVAYWQVPYGARLAGALFLLAALTEGLDGYLARKRRMVTRLGKIMDPLADKLLVCAALVSLVEMHRLPGWVAMIIIGRELAVTGLRSFLSREGEVLEASLTAKLKTACQVVALAALFWQESPFSWHDPTPANLALMAALLLTLLSGWDYFRRGWAVIKKGGY